MNITQGKIGGREFFAIIILTIGTKLADETPAILFEEMANAAWITMLFIGLFSIIPIYFVAKLITFYRDKNLIDITLHLFGKYIGFFVLFILWGIVVQTTTISSAVYTDIIGTMYFTKTPTIIIYAILIAVAAYGAKKGLEHIGSTAWFTLLWIKISLFVVLIIAFVQGQTNFLFPIWGPGQWEVVKESMTNTSILGDFLLLALIATSIKSTTVFRKTIWTGFIFVTVEITLALIGYVLLFDYVGIKMMNYPFHETIRYIELGFLTNVESLFFPFWLLASFIRFSFYLYICALLFGALFKVQQFEYIIPTLATLIVFLGMLPETPVFNLTEYREKLLYLITPIFFLLPCLLWGTAKLKGEFKK